MFQAKANLNASPCSEGENKKKKRKKTHIYHSRKHHSNHGHSKYRKRWDLNINNHHLKHAQYASDYIGPERLTKHLLGFLGKGKISDSISRLEKIMPAHCKADSKYDLDRVLNDSSSEIHSYSQYKLHTSQNCRSSQDESNSNSSSPDFHRIVHKSPLIESRKQPLNFSGSVDANNSRISSRNSVSPLCDNKYDEIIFCREVITKNLHSAINNANKVVFPSISNQNCLIKELFHLKNQYNSCKKALSNSNNCKSSQEAKNTGSFENLEKKDFKLKPILTQATPIVKNIENMFPDFQDISSDSDSIMSDGSVSLLTNDMSMGHNHDDTKLSFTSSGREGSLILIPSSPISSSGSPVWVPESSPIKFLPDTLPTPKLFYRQKMF